MERQARDLRETVTVAVEVCDQMPGSLILATDVLHVAVRKCVCSRLLLAVDNKRGPRTQIILSTSHYRLVANTKVGPSATLRRPPGDTARDHCSDTVHRTENDLAILSARRRRTAACDGRIPACSTRTTVQESPTRLPYMTVQSAMSQTPDHDHGTP